MIKIIVDSTADLAKNIENKVIRVPMTIRFGDEEYIDGVTISHTEFYEKLIECDTIPQTSQATPDNFMKVLDEVIGNGDEALVITLSSKLSGTYQSALIAADEYDGKVFVVDSESVAVGTGILVEFALQLAESGKMSVCEIASVLEKERGRIKVIALLDTLEYLKKGGRISKTAAIAGGLLSIKPVVSLADGEVKMLGTARGSKQGNNLLMKIIAESGGIDFSKPILLGYTGLSDAVLQKYIEDSSELWKDQTANLPIKTVGCTIGTHAGPGAIAIAFFEN